MNFFVDKNGLTKIVYKTYNVSTRSATDLKSLGLMFTQVNCRRLTRFFLALGREDAIRILNVGHSVTGSYPQHAGALLKLQEFLSQFFTLLRKMSHSCSKGNLILNVEDRFESIDSFCCTLLSFVINIHNKSRKTRYSSIQNCG